MIAAGLINLRPAVFTLNGRDTDAAGEFGDLCANIYLFTPDGKMSACCACPVKQNGLLELSINDLVQNPVTGVAPTKGAIKIVSSSDCYPPYPNPMAGMKTDVRTRSNTYTAITPVPDSRLGGFEFVTLKRQATAIQRNGGGLGYMQLRLKPLTAPPG